MLGNLSVKGLITGMSTQHFHKMVILFTSTFPEGKQNKLQKIACKKINKKSLKLPYNNKIKIIVIQ